MQGVKSLPSGSLAVCDVPSAELYTETYKVLRARHSRV